MKESLKTFEKDLKEFKDINRRYRDQLIKVKVWNCFVALQEPHVDHMLQLSDMANADLEKYAKALDR